MARAWRRRGHAAPAPSCVQKPARASTSSCRGYGAPAAGGGAARLYAGVPLAPLVGQRVHAFFWGEVGVDQVEHEYVGVGWWGIAHRGEVLAHRSEL